MTPEKGQHVKCFMRSTMVLEGVVEDWTDAQVVLKSIDGQSIMIVHRPVEDIMLTKIVVTEPQEILEEKSQENLPEEKQEIREKLQEVMAPTGDTEVDKMNLDQLRRLVSEQEKQMITHKKRMHFGTPEAPKKAVQYSSPFNTRKK